MTDRNEYLKIYEEWLKNSDGWMKKDLMSLKEMNVSDLNQELFERFGITADFGTGGLRNIIRSGLNGINDFWVRRICLGLAKSMKSVAIAYDTRHKSSHFANIAAKTLAENGCTVYIFDESVPTPVLSFTVKEKKCDGGIVITASHNPKNYNGFKVYDKNGVQYSPEKVMFLKEDFKEIPFLNPKRISDSDGTIIKVSKAFYSEYFSAVFQELNQFNHHSSNNEKVSVVYSPLFGTGAKFVPEIMRYYGIDVIEVKEQMIPNGDFPSLKVPNPENPESFKEALKLSEFSLKKPEILLTTDPDADRLGVFIYDGDEYISLNGNELGMLLLDYIVSYKKSSDKPYAILKTIVTTDMAKKFAEVNNLMCFETLTGFKYLGEKALELRKKGVETLFSFEESFGYLYGDHAGDKDACSTSGLLALMLKEYGSGKRFLERLQELGERYGFYRESLCTHTSEGIDGRQKMDRFINTLRHTDPEIIWKRKAILKDYNFENGELNANVIEFIFNKQEKVIFRPSGTEPKIKAYLSVNTEEREKTDQKILSLEKEVISLFERI